MSKTSLNRQISIAAEQLETASSVIDCCGSLIRAIRKANEYDASRLLTVAEIYIDNWVDLLQDSAVELGKVAEGLQK